VRRAEGKYHAWYWEVIHDPTSDSKSLKWLSVVDEYTRECLALEVGRELTGRRLTKVLDRLSDERVLPGHIRSDAGPEFISGRVRRWLAGHSAPVPESATLSRPQLNGPGDTCPSHNPGPE
jgi:transposase InsO family protein